LNINTGEPHGSERHLSEEHESKEVRVVAKMASLEEITAVKEVMLVQPTVNI
jgi:hypothetical protein